jgi:hypothetical protein
MRKMSNLKKMDTSNTAASVSGTSFGLSRKGKERGFSRSICTDIEPFYSQIL